MWKGEDTWSHKTFEERIEIRKIKIHMSVWLLICSHVHWMHEKNKNKVQVPQQNEMLSLYCTTLGFISKNEEYNPK